MNDTTRASIKAAAITTGVFVVFLGFIQLQAVFDVTNHRMDGLIKEANIKLTQMDARIKKLEAPVPAQAPKAEEAKK